MNVYFGQFNIDYGKDHKKKILYFPYSAGCIWAYANQFSEIKNNYTLKQFFIEKVDPKEIVDSLDNPKVFGFSVYLWNCNYSLHLAKLIKERYPNCVIVFGGPHVPTQDENWLKKNYWIDYAVYKEGEIVFHNLLRRLLSLDHSVAGLGFLHNGALNPQSTPQRIMDLDQMPSPYTAGYFDALVEKYKKQDVVLNATIETNRGCPFSCTFCDWGGVTESKVKKFNLCKVFAEIDWMSQNKIEFVISADANFGAFKQRDIEICQYVAQTKLKTGYPKYFHLNWHKNQSEHLVTIAKILLSVGAMKNYSASLQSKNKTVLDAIKRKNTGDDIVNKIQSLCQENGFPLHTELMLPLPEETWESFKDCLEFCVEKNITFTCSHTTMLPNSEMSNKAYCDRYGLKTTLNDFNENHNWTKEVEEVLIETNSMSKKQFNDLMLISFLIGSIHFNGFTDLIAKYYKKTEGIQYTEFYEKLLNYIKAKPNVLLHKHLKSIFNHVDDKTTSLTYGGLWSIGMYNEIGKTKRELFFSELKDFCIDVLPENYNIDDLFSLQYNWQNCNTHSSEINLHCKSNLFDYITSQTSLTNKNTIYKIEASGVPKVFMSLGHYLHYSKSLAKWKNKIIKVA